MSKRKDLRNARAEKNDEFYTPLPFIEEELSRWKDKLNGKKIICPCDLSPFENTTSLTFVYDGNSVICKLNAVAKKLTLWDDEATSESLSAEEAESIISKDIKGNFVRYLCSIAKEVGINSITVSGYDPETKNGISFENVDYTQYDICITNPPFSLYGNFMNKMLDAKSRKEENNERFDFILLAPFINRIGTYIGIPLMEKTVYLGYGRCVHPEFIVPEGKDVSRVVACDWITTFDDAQKWYNKQYPDFNLVSYDLHKDEYEIMGKMTFKDGSHPIKLPNKNMIPDRYDGWMFTNIDILTYLNTDKYEWVLTNAYRYFNVLHPEKNPFSHRISDDIFRGMFHGILFRKKKNLVNQND